MALDAHNENNTIGSYDFIEMKISKNRMNKKMIS